MKDFLNTIVRDIKKKKKEVFENFSLSKFCDSNSNTFPPTKFNPNNLLALIKKNFFLITECKKASPSKGVICPDYSPSQISKEYKQGGASAISVLVEENYFQGHPHHLKSVTQLVDLPVLWKDFIIHEQQIAEAKLNGASFILLIARILNQKQLQSFVKLSLDFNILPFIEIFNQSELSLVMELEKPLLNQILLGVNNRDLETFVVDINHSLKIKEQLSHPLPIISESGIKTHEDILWLKKNGFQGALVGESLLKQTNRQEAVEKLLHG